MTVILTYFAALVMGGCAFDSPRDLTRNLLEKTAVVDSTVTRRGETWVLPRGAAFYLAFPVWQSALQSSSIALTAPESFPRTRAQLARELEQILSARSPTSLADREFSVEEALAAAWMSGCDVLLYPVLLKASNNLNSLEELSAQYGTDEGASVGRDRLGVVIRIYDVRSAKLLDTVATDSRSSMAAYRQRDPTDLIKSVAVALDRRLGGGGRPD